MLQEVLNLRRLRRLKFGAGEDLLRWARHGLSPATAIIVCQTIRHRLRGDGYGGRFRALMRKAPPNRV